MRIERQLYAVECTCCGALHELVYVANQGAVGGGDKYLCRIRGLRSYVDMYDGPTKKVTLGLTPDTDECGERLEDFR